MSQPTDEGTGARMRRLGGDMTVFPIGLGCMGIAWALAKGELVVPVVGARTRAQLFDALGALEVRLTPEEVARIEAAVPAGAVAGTRYGEAQMQALDSER